MTRALITCLAIGAAAADVPALAQGSEPRVSVGGFISGLGLSDDAGWPKTSIGIGSSLMVHVEGPLTLEGRIVWFPSDEAITFESQGGKTLEVVAGVRGTFFTSRRIRLDGILQPGIIRFSRTETGYDDGSKTIGARTRLALNLGAGITLFPQARFSPRVDVGRTFYVVPGSVLYASPDDGDGSPRATATSRAMIANARHIFAGLDYRLAARQPSSARSSAQAGRRLTIGAQFAFGVRATISDLPPVHDPGGGAFISYRLAKYVFAEGVFNAFAAKPAAQTPWDGGRVSQVLGGVTAGLRGQRVGIYAKVRAGVSSHNDAFQGRDRPNRTVTLGRSSGPALDFGGLVEVDAGAHSVLRLEAGHVTSFYRARSIVLDGVTVEQGSERSTGSIQMAVGFGWRF